MSTPNPAPQPDPTCALALSRANYWVVPLVGHRKHPPRFGDRTHGDILRDGDKSFMDALVIAQQHTATGWALILQPADPVPLAAVDVDAYGIFVYQAWQMLSNDELPTSLGIVQSATGGWHFYFRLPDALTAKRLPDTWDFGQGRKGEIRASRDALQLIVLPGSVVLNKHGALARYESAGHPLTDPEGLALIPDPLLARFHGHLKAGGPGDAPSKEGLPTEAQHLLTLLHFISEIPPGEQNAQVARIGQILGRIGPGDKLGPDLVSLAWDQLRDRLPARDPSHPWTFATFERALTGGYKTGARNRTKHTAATSTPSVTDVKAECESLFGSLPWLVRVEDSKGVFQEYILGHGGSPEQREQATAICSIKDSRLTNLLAEISRIIPGVDQDVLVRSPLFVVPEWGKVLRHMLLYERTPERVGNSAEDQFWAILNEWARGAAQDGKFLDTLSGPWAALDCRCWIVAPAQEESLFALHPEIVERLYLRIGDMPAVKRLLAQHTRKAALKGRAGHQILLAVSHLAPETQAHVRAGYNGWVARGRKGGAEDDDTA